MLQKKCCSLELYAWAAILIFDVYMPILSEIKNLSDLFGVRSLCYIQEDSLTTKLLLAKCQKMNGCYWVESEAVQHKTNNDYSRYIQSYEYKTLLETIIELVFGKKVFTEQQDSALISCWRKNDYSAVFLNNAQILKPRTVINFIDKGKYYTEVYGKEKDLDACLIENGEIETKNIEVCFRVFFVPVFLTGSKLPLKDFENYGISRLKINN